MIQRRQSLYLLIIAAIAAILLFANLKYAGFSNEESGKKARLGYTTTVISDNAGEQSIPKWINVLILGGICAGSLSAIFLFKKRDLQKKICIYITLLSAVLTLLMVMDYNSMSAQFANNTTYPGIWSVFPLSFVVLGFMAWRGVRKDEDLIKSMDRIR